MPAERDATTTASPSTGPGDHPDRPAAGGLDAHPLTLSRREALLGGCSMLAALAILGCGHPEASTGLGPGEAWDDGTYWDDGTGWV